MEAQDGKPDPWKTETKDYEFKVFLGSIERHSKKKTRKPINLTLALPKSI